MDVFSFRYIVGLCASKFGEVGGAIPLWPSYIINSVRFSSATRLKCLSCKIKLYLILPLSFSPQLEHWRWIWALSQGYKWFICCLLIAIWGKRKELILYTLECLEVRKKYFIVGTSAQWLLLSQQSLIWCWKTAWWKCLIVWCNRLWMTCSLYTHIQYSDAPIIHFEWFNWLYYAGFLEVLVWSGFLVFFSPFLGGWFFFFSNATFGDRLVI